MFQRNEFQEIDRTYFDVKEASICNIVLKSKSCGHILDIQGRELLPGKRSLVILHKHKESDPYHKQALMHPKTVAEAQDMIKAHDIWHLNGRC